VQRAVNEWEKKSGDHVVIGSYADGRTLCVDLLKKNAPDIIDGTHDQMGPLEACHVLAPVPAWAWPASSQRQYIAGVVKASTIAGTLYSMPWGAQTTGIFYNAALIGAGFFKPAKGDRYLRWSALIAKAQGLTKRGISGYVQPFELFYNYAFLRAFGGYVFGYTRTGFNYRDIGLATPGAIAGLRFLKDLSTDGKYKLVPPSMDQPTAERLFGSGQAAMLLDGPWEGQSLAGTSVHYGFVPLSSIDGVHPMHPFMTYYVEAVNAYSKHKNEAFSLLAYLTRRVQQFDAGGNTPVIPVLEKLLRSQIRHADLFTAGEAAAVATGDPMPNIPEMDQVWVPTDAAIQSVVDGRVSADAAAHTAVAEIQAAIAKEHGG
jgi:arabinogalactan oligomer/maltooligosaccharide transport system substrate-binding protein